MPAFDGTFGRILVAWSERVIDAVKVRGRAVSSRASGPSLIAVAALGVLVVRSAWVTEDAYITLRTVDNWVSGFGLRWNVAERVQVYTHPLWLFVLSAAYFVTREPEFTTIAVSVAVTLAAAVGLIAIARTPGHALAATVLLLMSRAFVDFSTSGLENPLTHLLVALFVWTYTTKPEQLSTVALCAAALALNRLDSVIIAVPALVHVSLLAWRAEGARAMVKGLAMGFSPLLAWETFSLFYYGFAVPNTAFAKLNTGLPQSELAQQGLTYLINAVVWDPTMMSIIAFGVGVGLLARSVQQRALALGPVLYLAYVVRVGGDFMLGRFLTLPLFMAVCVIATSQLRLQRPVRVAALVLPLVMLQWHPNARDAYQAEDFSRHGIADERMVYKRSSSLAMYVRGNPLPDHTWVHDGLSARTATQRVRIVPNVGFFGYYAGPRVHVVDALALTDPFLARLPAESRNGWRVGHYTRDIPTGYVETLESGRCQMRGELCKYYQRLRLVVSGDLWSWERLRTIVAMNLGKYDGLVDVDRGSMRH